MTCIDELGQVLAQQALRFRTGILVTDRPDRKSLDPVALRLPAFFVDYHRTVTDRLPVDARVVPIDPVDILADLKAVTSASGPSPFALIQNLDLALTKLSNEEIRGFWSTYSQLEPFSQTVIVAVIPRQAVSVQPVGQELEQWKEWKRIAFWECN